MRIHAVDNPASVNCNTAGRVVFSGFAVIHKVAMALGDKSHK
jgi:hypothetical protein